MIEGIVTYLTLLLAIAGAVTAAVEAIKPAIRDATNSNEGVYTALVYVVRFVAAFGGVIVLGGADLFRASLPANFSVVPDYGIIFLSSLLVAAGADILHGLRDFLYALRDGRREIEETQPTP